MSARTAPDGSSRSWPLVDRAMLGALLGGRHRR